MADNQAKMRNTVYGTLPGQPVNTKLPATDHSGVGDKLPEYGDDGDSFNIPNAYIPAKNPALQEILNRQIGQAKQFRDNIPNASNALFDGATRTAKGQLAATISDQRKEANKRGKFYSGQRVGAELGAKANTSAGLAGARQQINQGLLDQADSLENNAFNTAGNLAGQGPGLGAGALAGLANNITTQGKIDDATQTAAGGLLKGVGEVGGSYFGRKPKTTDKYNPLPFGTYSPADYSGGSEGGFDNALGQN